jgi:hypothetical protein
MPSDPMDKSSMVRLSIFHYHHSVLFLVDYIVNSVVELSIDRVPMNVFPQLINNIELIID